MSGFETTRATLTSCQTHSVQCGGTGVPEVSGWSGFLGGIKDSPGMGPCRTPAHACATPSVRQAQACLRRGGRGGLRSEGLCTKDDPNISFGSQKFDFPCEQLFVGQGGGGGEEEGDDPPPSIFHVLKQAEPGLSYVTGGIFARLYRTICISNVLQLQSVLPCIIRGGEGSEMY